MKPEEAARQKIDAMLAEAGWLLQDVGSLNVHAGRGVAVRELPLGKYGEADYVLYVDSRPVGVVEAKKEGDTLTGVEIQVEKYAMGIAEAGLSPVPVPFRYRSTGIETVFANYLDPEPRSRELFAFHRPETLATWLADVPRSDTYSAGSFERPSTLRARMRSLPPLEAANLWPAQVKAVQNLETSFSQGRPRALIQMATGSGKTFTAITSIYRLIKQLVKGGLWDKERWAAHLKRWETWAEETLNADVRKRLAFHVDREIVEAGLDALPITSPKEARALSAGDREALAQHSWSALAQHALLAGLGLSMEELGRLIGSTGKLLDPGSYLDEEFLRVLDAVRLSPIHVRITGSHFPLPEDEPEGL